MKSFVAETNRERKTDANMEFMLPPKRTKTWNERKTERRAEIREKREGVKEVILTVYVIINNMVIGAETYSIFMPNFACRLPVSHRSTSTFYTV